MIHHHHHDSSSSLPKVINYPLTSYSNGCPAIYDRNCDKHQNQWMFRQVRLDAYKYTTQVRRPLAQKVFSLTHHSLSFLPVFSSSSLFLFTLVFAGAKHWGLGWHPPGHRLLCHHCKCLTLFLPHLGFELPQNVSSPIELFVIWNQTF